MKRALLHEHLQSLSGRIANIATSPFPIGSHYTQYPVPGAATFAGMFPEGRSPAALFGGTWTERFQGEEVFFRAAGGNADTSGSQLGGRRGQRWNGSAWASGGVAGVEPDMIRDITGEVALVHGTGGSDPTNLHESGAFFNTGRQVNTGNAQGGGAVRLRGFASSRVVPTGAANQPRNRLIRVWERTA